MEWNFVDSLECREISGCLGSRESSFDTFLPEAATSPRPPSAARLLERERVRRRVGSGGGPTAGGPPENTEGDAHLLSVPTVRLPLQDFICFHPIQSETIYLDIRSVSHAVSWGCTSAGHFSAILGAPVPPSDGRCRHPTHLSPTLFLRASAHTLQPPQPAPWFQAWSNAETSRPGPHAPFLIVLSQCSIPNASWVSLTGTRHQRTRFQDHAIFPLQSAFLCHGAPVLAAPHCVVLMASRPSSFTPRSVWS